VTGSPLWQVTTTGPRGAGLLFADAAADSAGRVTVAGTSAAGAWDIAVGRLAADGSWQWMRRATGARGANDMARAVAVSASGSSYVGGWGSAAGYGSDGVVLKYDASGVLRWKYVLRTRGDDEIADIAIDGAGAVYALGTRNGSSRNGRIFLAKLTRTGRAAWTRTLGQTSVPHFGEKLITTKDGITVTGIWGGSTTNHPVVARYTSAGVRLWVTRDDTDMLEFGDAAVDPAGRVVVAGDAVGTDTTASSNLLVFDATGARSTLATFKYSTGDNPSTAIYALGVDGGSRVYAAVREGQTYTIYRYPAPAGTPWSAEQTWDGLIDDGDIVSSRFGSLLVAADDNVFVAGSRDAGSSVWVGCVKKLGASPTP